MVHSDGGGGGRGQVGSEIVVFFLLWESLFLFTGPRPLDLGLKAFPYRLLMGVVIMMCVWWANVVRGPGEEFFPLYFYLTILLVYAIHQVLFITVFMNFLEYFQETFDNLWCTLKKKGPSLEVLHVLYRIFPWSKYGWWNIFKCFFEYWCYTEICFSFGGEGGEVTHPHKLELTLGSFNICSYCEGIQSLVYTGVCCFSSLFDSKHANYLGMSSWFRFINWITCSHCKYFIKLTFRALMSTFVGPFALAKG